MGPDPTEAVGRRAAHGRWLLILGTAGAAVVAGGGIWLYRLRPEGGPGGRTPESLFGLGVVGLGLAMLVFALGFYVLAPGFRGRAAAMEGVGSHRLVLASTLLVVVLSNLAPIVFLLFGPLGGICSVPGFLSAALSVGVSLIGVTYFRLIRPGVLTADDLGLRASRLTGHVKTGISLGFLAFLVSAIIQVAMSGFGVRQTQSQDFQCIRQFPLAGFLVVLFAGAVLAPIAEELFFRGFVFGSYLRTQTAPVAYGLSSLLFATLHLNLPAVLPILTLGLLFAAAYRRTGSIVPGIVAHALFNLVGFVILYFVERPA